MLQATDLTRADRDTFGDGELVEQIRRGDEGAFFTLYTRYARFVAAIAYGLIGDNSEVDDVVQETFVALDRSMHKLKEPEHVKSWLAIVATRMVRKRLGKRTRRHRLSSQMKMLGPKHSDPRALEKVDELKRALDALPARLRAPWSINHLEGAPLAETAQRCGVSLATTKRRIRSAAEKLQRQLGLGRRAVCHAAG